MASGDKRKKQKRLRPQRPDEHKRRPAQPVGAVVRKPVTGLRLWLFRIAALTLVPAAALGLLEVALRLAGYGFPARAMVKDVIQGRTVYRDNPRFGWLFFPWNIAREPSPYRFEARKRDNAYRIFILGASAAQGAPDPAFAFSRILEAMLADHYPDINFEVINTAMVATNSHVVRRIARDCARHKPDLFIVYLGNNEVVGPFGAGTVFSPLTRDIRLIRAGIALKATRTGQLVSNVADRLAGRTDAPAVWTGMDMFLEKQVRADDESLRTVYAHFEKNLRDIRDIALKADAKVILSTVGVNLRNNPPFASLHRYGLSEEDRSRWQDLYDEGVALEENARCREAIDKYTAAAQIDDTYADLHFRLAVCHDRLGEPIDARSHYVSARDLDTLRFRADTVINATIARVAHELTDPRVRFVDAAEALAAASPDGITGKELFHEHVHLDFTGNYVIAGQLFDRISELLPPSEAKRRVADSPLRTEQQCRDALLYNPWAEYASAAEVLNGFIKKPPFTGQLYHELRAAGMEDRVRTLRAALTPEKLSQMDAQYRRAIAAGKADWWIRWKYAEFLSDQMRNERAASAQYRFVADYLPHYAQVWAKLGTSLGKQGDLDSAVTMNLHAVELSPAHVFAHHNLAFAYQMRGLYDEALRHYRLAIKYKPDYPEAYNNLGAILYQQGHVDEAVAVYREATTIVQDYADLYYNLGVIFEETGRLNEAVEQYQAALKVDPDSPKLQKALQIARAKQKTPP